MVVDPLMKGFNIIPAREQIGFDLHHIGYALDKLTQIHADKFPETYKPLRENWYVDDLLSGDHTEVGRDEQIQAVEEVLKRGGFPLKFIVKSREKPAEKASTDGEILK